MNKIIKQVLALFLVLMLALPCVVTADTSKIAKGTSEEKSISIVFSHDMHSHLEKFSKIATIIKKVKKENKATFVLDGGDFSMGTPYQSIYKTEASELRMMGAVGYDVTTIGNHEFDFRSIGLTQMLNRAVASKSKLPEIVISNIDWSSTLGDGQLKSDGEKLKAALNNYGAKKYTIIEKDGMKIAVFGIFGNESASYAPESGTLFKDPIESAQKVVQDIQDHERVDLVVCVSHSGTNSDPEKSEDEILAKRVDGIDLIISGHSHTELKEPIIENGTAIVSAGQYNNSIGTLNFVEKNGKWQLQDYNLVPLNNQVKKDAKTEAKVAKFKRLVNKDYFAKYGLSWNQTLAYTDFDLTNIDDFGNEQGEDILGNLITDSFIYGVKEAEGYSYEKVDVAVAPAGGIRGSFNKGYITTADAFNALSIGTGKDGLAGYPLVSVYLTGSELKTAAEVDISISPLMQPARLYMSGLSYKYNPNRLILNRAFDIKLDKGNNRYEELEDDKLYRVISDLYSTQMLSTVTDLSYGILSITPKDKNGNEIKNFEDFIVRDQSGKEVKEWYALASYINSFNDGKVPTYYESTQNRKVLEDSKKLSDLFKSPNKYFWMIIAAVVLVIAVITLIIVLIVKLIHRIRYGKGGKRMRKKDMIFSRGYGRYR